MIVRLSSVRALLYAWLAALALIVVAQLMSAALMPRGWRFFWLIPVEGTSPLALARVLGSMWLGLWNQRPFEAFSLTIMLLVLAFTVAWLLIRLWLAGQQVIIARRAV